MTQNLFELLSTDERIIVYSSQEDGVIYTWNQDKTLMCWAAAGSLHVFRAMPADQWQDIGVLKQEEPALLTYKQARDRAIAWHTDSNEV